MPPTGHRARKVARTRRAIAEAALSAFLARGYDNTTLDEVAEAANVHKRTLLRHFPTKAHLVLDGHYKALEELRTGLAAPGDAPILTVWENHIVRWSEKIAEKGPLANIGAMAASEPAIRHAQLAIHAQYAELLFDALWKEYSYDPHSEMMCQVAAAALAGGNFAVAARLHAAGAYGEFVAKEREVIRLVKRTLLKTRPPPVKLRVLW